MYTGGIHVIRFLFIFLLLICLLLQGWGLSQQPRMVEGKFFFLTDSLATHDGIC